MRSSLLRSCLVVLLALLASSALATPGGFLGDRALVKVAPADLPRFMAAFDTPVALETSPLVMMEGKQTFWLTQEQLGKAATHRIALEIVEDDRQPLEMLSMLKVVSPASNSLLEYHDYEELTDLLAEYAETYPNITQLFTWGKSVSGRELWGLRITDQPTIKEQAEPEFVYIGNMHGDETVGREMLINFIGLLLSEYGRDAELTELVDTTDIYIVPSMNPDGFERARRSNDNGFDLNRNFPDQFQDPNNTPTGRQPETRAVMAFWDEHNVVMAANMHGGTLCVNYPYDDFATPSQCGRAISYSPDHDLYVDISLSYSKLNPPMYSSNEFNQGITNGAEWYCITGSMQDWSYVWYGTLHVTIELSHVKYPAASTLAGFWEDNREALIAYMQNVHRGVKGRVFEKATGKPIKATVNVQPHNMVKESLPIPSVRTDQVHGDFFRVVLPGTYDVTVTTADNRVFTKVVTVPEGKAIVVDFAI